MLDDRPEGRQRVPGQVTGPSDGLVKQSRRRRLVVSTITGSGFTAALHVRDCLGLSVADSIPPLTPAVERVPAPAGAGVSADAWRRWWRSLERADAGGFVAPKDAVLAAFVEQVRAEAQDWGGAEIELALASYQPEWLEPAIAAGNGLGRHDTEVLPVAGAWTLSINDRRLLVSTETYQDHAAMDALWEARIRPLLGA